MESSPAPPATPTTCRLCGGPAGPSEECPSCERELSSYIDGLVAELSDGEKIAEAPGDLAELARLAPAPSASEPSPPEATALEPPAPEPSAAPESLSPEPSASPEPLEPESAAPPAPPEAHRPQTTSPPPRRRGRRTLIAAVALAALATAGSLAVSQGDPDGPALSDAPEQVAEQPPAPAPEPGPTPDPALPPQSNAPTRFEYWSGQARVRYEYGAQEKLAVSLRFGPLEPGKVVGSATTLQDDTECHGSLTSLGRVDGVFRFAYREFNTRECTATSRIRLTPAGEDRLAFEETTEVSVNRGTLTRE